MPFVKVKRKGRTLYRGPSGRTFNRNQVRRYYARGQSFDAICNCGNTHEPSFFCDAKSTSSSDPTGTLQIRRSLARELEQRWRRLKLAVNKVIRDDDSFALSSSSIMAAQVISTEGGRLKAFQTWLDNSLSMLILGHDNGAWLASPISRGYNLGTQRANRLLGTKDAWDPSKHPRHPAGNEQGGEFASSGGGVVSSGDKVAAARYQNNPSDDRARSQLTKLANKAKAGDDFDHLHPGEVTVYRAGSVGRKGSSFTTSIEQARKQLFVGQNTLIKLQLKKSDPAIYLNKINPGSRYSKEREVFINTFEIDRSRYEKLKISDSLELYDNIDRTTLLTNAAAIELQGIMEAVSQQCVRAFNAAMLSNSAPREAAFAINKIIDEVGNNRSKAFASVSVVQAHATGTLDTFQSRGITRVGMEPEFQKTKLMHDAYDPSQPRSPKGYPDGGQWVSGYHGSPTAGIEELKGEFAFLTQDPNVAAQYAKNELLGAQQGAVERNPTVYEIEAKVGELFDLRNEAHRAVYEQVRQEFNARHDDPDEKLPSLKSQGFIQSSGLPGFGNATTILRELETRGFHAMRVSEGSQGESIVVRDPKNRARITRHYTPDSILLYDARKKKRPTARQQTLFTRREAKLSRLGNVNVETAGDSKVCPICEDLAEDGPYSIDAARGLIPAHPSCRCAFVPADEDE